jgi:hypothetical protein
LNIFRGGLDDGGESGLLADFSPSSPLHKTTSHSPTSPPFGGNQQNGSAAGPGGRAAPGRLEFSPEKAGLDVTPLNLDFLDRTQQPPQPLAALAGKIRLFIILAIDVCGSMTQWQQTIDIYGDNRS